MVGKFVATLTTIRTNVMNKENLDKMMAGKKRWREQSDSQGIVEKSPGSIKCPSRVLHTVDCADGGTKTLSINKTKSIFLFCTQCLGWEDHPDTCTVKRCPLYPFRGKTLASHRSDNK